MPAATLGQKYKDSITGFEGVATSRTCFINGCIQVGLTAACVDNKPAEHDFFDEQRLLDEYGNRLDAAPTPTPARAGGPQRTPDRRGVSRT